MKPEETMRAALYLRVSTEEQARHGLSLGDQRAKLEAYAKAHGMAIVGFYEDAGISARKPYKKRPALLQLLADVEEKKIDIILFIKLDRWFRNVGNYYAVQETLDRNGVVWQATEEDYETQTAAGRLKVNIMLSVAQDEADRTSERIKFVFEGKRARGEALTGDKPKGYIIRNKKFEKDPETEEAVAAFFEKFLSCGSLSRTRDYIRDKYGLELPYQVADKMLRSTAYYGCYYDTDGMCPPYITREQYDTIQSMRVHIVRKSPHNRVYLFASLITCMSCGGKLGGKPNQNKLTYHYNCANHFVGRKPCDNNKSISERKLERYLLDAIVPKLDEYKAEMLRVREQERTENYAAAIASYRAKLSRLKELYLNELISLDEYRQDWETFTQKIAELEAKQSQAPAINENIKKVEALLSTGWRDIYASLPRERKQEFWRLMVKEIRWYNDRRIEFDLNL